MRSPSPWLVATILLLFLGDTIHSAHAIQVDSATPLFRFVNHLNQLVWVVVFQRVDNVDYDYVRAWLVSSVGAQGGSLTIPQVLGTDLNVTAQHDATTAYTNRPAQNNGGAFVVRVEDWRGFSLYSNSTSGKTLLLNVLDNPKKWDIKFLLSKADSTVVPTAITSWAGDRNPSDMLNISLPYDIFFVAVYLTESQVPKQGDNIPFSSLDLRFVRDVYTNAGQEPAVDLVYYKDSWYLNVSNSYCAQLALRKATLRADGVQPPKYALRPSRRSCVQRHNGLPELRTIVALVPVVRWHAYTAPVLLTLRNAFVIQDMKEHVAIHLSATHSVCMASALPLTTAHVTPGGKENSVLMPSAARTVAMDVAARLIRVLVIVAGKALIVLKV